MHQRGLHLSETRVYEFSPSPRAVQVAIPWDDAKEITGLPLASEWEPVAVEMITVDERRHELKWMDFLACPGFPCVGERGFAVLNEFFSKDGELLPVTSLHGDFWLFNVTHMEPLDEERSVVDRLEDGQIFWIDDPVFADDTLEEVSWLRPTQVPTGMPFLTRRCLDVLYAHGLTGIVPIPFPPPEGLG